MTATETTTIKTTAARFEGPRGVVTVTLAARNTERHGVRADFFLTWADAAHADITLGLGLFHKVASLEALIHKVETKLQGQGYTRQTNWPAPTSLTPSQWDEDVRANWVAARPGRV